MYEDAWYSYQPDTHKDGTSTVNHNHKRRESLLKQLDGDNQSPDFIQPGTDLYEDTSSPKGPPEATLARRAKSYSDFYEVANSLLRKEAKTAKPRDILDVPLVKPRTGVSRSRFVSFESDLLDSSHEEFQLYKEQLELSDRHLDDLIGDATAALDLLTDLSESFKAVDSQTTAFQAQCEDLLAEQKRVRELADEIGLNLQYYAYLEPLTRRLNAPGAGRIIKSDDFTDMLLNLNTCITFMEEHPTYRDSSIYKTRYISLLEKALNLVQIGFSSALREVSDEVAKQLRSKDHSETAEYIMLYGKYENIMSNLGSQVEKLFTTDEFAFGQSGDGKTQAAYVSQWHNFYSHVLDAYFKSRESVGPLIIKNLRKFAAREPSPEKDFKAFARRCAQYVLDICDNEWSLLERFFRNGPFFAVYPGLLINGVQVDYIARLEENQLTHLTVLHNFLSPYFNAGDLQRISDFTGWLETMDLSPSDGDFEGDRKPAVQALLSKHLWPLSDEQFLKAAKEIEYFKPSPEDLAITKTKTAQKATALPNLDADVFDSHDTPVSNAFPTVKSAVKLLILYNDGAYDRPRSGDVLYEIVHQATGSLQRAATLIKRTTTIMDAQLFLIKNLMLIENLFMTHEIPDSVRQSAEFDFSPIWATIKELQERKQLFNPLAYLTPLVKGQLLPGVKDQLLDARKELEKVLVQQITAFTRYWQSRLSGKDAKSFDAASGAANELQELLDNVFDDETTPAALWKMIRT